VIDCANGEMILLKLGFFAAIGAVCAYRDAYSSVSALVRPGSFPIRFANLDSDRS
jgi:hypothetical protein